MSQHLITTPAKSTKCPGCGAALLVGLSDGLSARVDETPITPADEFGVLAKGLWTYIRIPSGYLIHRTAGHITSGRPRGAIHAQHQCHQPDLNLSGELDQLAAARASRVATQQRQRQSVRTGLAVARLAGKTAGHSARLHTRAAS
jgi:hypothetical protein